MSSKPNAQANRRQAALKRSVALIALGLAVALGHAAVAGQDPTQQPPFRPKPNIVLVLMDNLGYGELGVYGGGILRGAPTPRLDKLSSEGMRLLNFNVEAQCTPSRAALLTGRYAVRTGNGSVPSTHRSMDSFNGNSRWPKLLSEAGYATGAFGKWHLGQTKGRFPTDQGFDEWYGIPNSTDEAYWPDNPLFRPNSDPFAVAEHVM